jgi:predicted phage-related endonuclease
MLTPEAVAGRCLGIGGSDAMKIVSGDWYELFMEKTGRSEPDDLSGVWPVQLGIITESLNLDWYERKFDCKVSNRGCVAVHSTERFMRCTLDGWVAGVDTVIQAKHVNAFSKIADVRERYTPQVMHEMIVTNAAKGVLSVIIGAAEPVYELIERDEFWEVDYIEKCREFWRYVEEDRAPEQGAPMEIAPAVPALMRVVDMTGNNAFAAHAATWTRFKSEAKAWETSAKELKALVEADVREASGYGITISRSKAGALTIKESK